MSEPQPTSTNQSQGNFGIGNMSGGTIGSGAVVAGSIGEIKAEKLYINNQPAEPLLVRLENEGKVDGAGVVRTGHLPKTTEYWQGRKTELADLKEWLQDSAVKLVGIEAIGGMGKSSLAAKIYRNKEIGITKRYWADGIGGANFAQVARQLLTDFGHPFADNEAQFPETVVQCLCAGEYLLIVDNLESLLDEGQDWQATFFGQFFKLWREYGCNSTVLVTTRERPTLPDFDEWLLLTGLAAKEGAALLAAYGIGEAEPGELERFSELVNGHPLLLTLVATLLKKEFPKGKTPRLAYLDKLGLGNLRQLITDERLKGLHRQETVGMALVLEASFERLSGAQQRLFLAVSVFQKRFNAGMAAAVTDLPTGTDIETALRGMAERSLLGMDLDEETFERTYEMQPVVKEYAQYQAGDNGAAHRKAIAYYAARLNENQDTWETLDDVQEYLDMAHHLTELGELENAVYKIRECDHFLMLRGYSTTRIEVYGPIIRAYENQPNPEQHQECGLALNSVGIAYWYLGQYEKAIDFYQKSLEIKLESGDRQGEAKSCGNLGIAYNSLGQYEKAIAFHQKSLEVKLESGGRQGEAISYGNLGCAYSSLGQYEKAIEFHQKQNDIAREIGDRQGEANSYGGLGIAYQSLGQYEKAIEFQQKLLDIALEIGDRQGEAKSYGNLGLAYQSLGQYEKAIEFQQKSLEIKLEIGDRQGEAKSYGNLGCAYDSLGQYEKAIEFTQKYLKIALEIGDRQGEAIALCNLGEFYFKLEQYQQALDYCERGLKIAKEIGIPSDEDEELKQKILDAMS